MKCSNCNTNPATHRIVQDGTVYCVCRACWESLSRLIDESGLNELVVDKSEEQLYGLCECGEGWFYHLVDANGYITGYECVGCGNYTPVNSKTG
jgi:protein-arginine kinase activator protein McsA